MRAPVRLLRDAQGRRYALVVAPREPRVGGWFLSREARLAFPLILVLVSGAACILLARYLTRPIRIFRNTGQRIAAGDLSARVGTEVASRRDEFGALARDFDRMADRIQALLNAQQRLLRDVSHELRSPLARLQAAVGLIRQRSGETTDANLDRIEHEANNLNAMIGQVLRYSRLEGMDTIDRESLNLTEVVQDIVQDAQYEGRSLDRTVSFESVAPVTVQGDELLIRSAIENVVRNALQHSSEAAQVSLERTTDEWARVTIRDDGPGVREGDLERLFEPFFSGDRASGGAGIGLAIARRAVDLHGGKITARNADGAGLIVQIELPKF